MEEIEKRIKQFYYNYTNEKIIEFNNIKDDFLLYFSIKENYKYYDISSYDGDRILNTKIFKFDYYYYILYFIVKDETNNDFDDNIENYTINIDNDKYEEFGVYLYRINYIYICYKYNKMCLIDTIENKIIIFCKNNFEIMKIKIDDLKSIFIYNNETKETTYYFAGTNIITKIDYSGYEKIKEYFIRKQKIWRNMKINFDSCYSYGYYGSYFYNNYNLGYIKNNNKIYFKKYGNLCGINDKTIFNMKHFIFDILIYIKIDF